MGLLNPTTRCTFPGLLSVRFALNRAGVLLVSGFKALLLLCLAASAQGADSVVISELMAQNSGGLHDQDGDSPDWIELHNASTNTIDLLGWHLSDELTNLTKWTFPATNLPPDGYLLVFASGKDRALSGAELHTNFKLGAEGDYLGLILPDGVTAVSQYAPAFPPQFPNRSFGTGRQVTVMPLVVAGARVRFLVPTDGALGDTWTAAGFDDSAWSSGATGLGFDSSSLAGTNRFGRVVLSIDFDDDDSGETGPANTEASFNQMTLGANPCVFNGITVALSAVGGGLLDDRDRTSPVQSASLTQDQLYDDFVFVNGQTNGNGLRLDLSGLKPHQDYYLQVWSFDSGSAGSRVSDWIETASGITNVLVTGYTFDGSKPPLVDGDDTFGSYVRTSAGGNLTLEARRSGGTSHGVFLNALQLTELGYHSLLGTDIGAVMSNQNASVYARVPFTVANSAALPQLALRMKYDDGFVACINGQVVAARNAPADPVWNSAATTARSNASATVFEEIPVHVTPGLLRDGTNILAIQGLNFGASDGDFLLLPELDGVRVDEFPNRYFTAPTPGAPNNPGALGLVPGPDFSVSRGFFNSAFSVVLTDSMPGVEIRWTTNGSAPSLTTGFLYSGPLWITNTTVLRVVAFRSGYAASDVVTHTYLFLPDILRQPNSMAGYPAAWQANYPADYAMDPSIVSHPVYGASILDDLRSIPTLSIVTEHDGLWGPLDGIYNHATSDTEQWERSASVELLGTNGATLFAVNCGLRMQGNASRDNVRTPKHSFRLLFKSAYGPSKLAYPLFADSPVVEFDNIVLRACFTDSWATRFSPADSMNVLGERYRPQDALYLRDVWMKDSFAALGHLSAHSIHVHLYLNGLYWGLYNPCERLDASFFSLHSGGAEASWDVIRDFSEVLDGTKDDWNAMMALCNAGVTNQGAYEAVCNLVDVPNLIDYLLLHFFAEAEDWPQHNWYAAHRRASNALPATKWIFLPWDQEIVCDQDYVRDRVDVSDNDTPARIYSQLRTWPEFRREFGDRIQKHLFNGGALSPDHNASRFAFRSNTISNAIVAESARWGDAREFDTPGTPGTGITFTRDECWLPELQKLLTNWFPRQQAVALERFRKAGLYPAVAPPQFNQFGGQVPAGFNLELAHTNASGIPYFTLDGSDPRIIGSGGIAPGAQPYGGPLPLRNSATVRARVFSEGAWSALVEATFTVPAEPALLQLSEIYYNPPGSGTTPGDEFEFLELANTGSTPLDLNGFRFTNGITFAFTNPETLGPGAYCVLVRNPASFTARFPGVSWQGQYSGKLDNSGERLTLVDAAGQIVSSLSYAPSAPWPVTGQSNSLQRINTATAYGNPINWAAASPTPGGPPSMDVRDSDNDGMPDVWERAHGLNAQADDAGQDLDRDGMDNLSEFRFGTDPQAAQNFFRLGVNPARGDPTSIVLDFYQLPGRSYLVEQKASLAEPLWNSFYLLDTAAAAGPVYVTNKAAATGSAFYRLVVRTSP